MFFQSHTQRLVLRPIAQCDWRNRAGYHVMEKLGMTRTAVGVRTYRDDRGTAAEYTYTLDFSDKNCKAHRRKL